MVETVVVETLKPDFDAEDADDDDVPPAEAVDDALLLLLLELLPQAATAAMQNSTPARMTARRPKPNK
jgi:hypothetical protein